jgi:phosphatidylinositol alpha-mannosyltransferase
VRIWVAGTGPDTDLLRTRHAGDPRIEWLGRISDDEKARRIRGADVFCAPSLGGESFGIVLLEAMAGGAVLVASDLPGYRNVARPGIDALMVPPGDVDALGAALRTALANGDRAAALVDAGSERAQHFSMESLAGRYLDLFAELVDVR